MNSAFLLDIADLKVAFHKHLVLSGVNFQIKRGEVVAIIGRSGCGKTVFLRTLAGLLKPQAGQINFNFENIQAVPVGFAFQKSPLLPWLSVLENLILCAKTENEKLRCKELLKNVGLDAFKDHFPQDISGGMAQKVNLLRALSNNCELILMDEPFGSLDGFQRSELQQFTHDICRSKGRSLILITHDIDEALLLSDRIFILSSIKRNFSQQISVNMDKPKFLTEMRSHQNYNNLYQKVLQALRDADAEAAQ